MADRTFNVLFLCTHNSARSIRETPVGHIETDERLSAEQRRALAALYDVAPAVLRLLQQVRYAVDIAEDLTERSMRERDRTAAAREMRTELDAFLGRVDDLLRRATTVTATAPPVTAE